MASESKSQSSEAPWWDWDSDEDGKLIEGTFVRADIGHTQMGPRPFVVLDVDGVYRTLWLHHSVLRSVFAREVARRPDRTIHVGERIRIWQLEPRESASNSGRSYVDYKAEFPDGPELSQSDVFGAPPEATPLPEFEDAAVGGGALDTDVPFR